ncbi:MAG: hypothetical protein COU11_01645 [Candidatus Harrisonbacteria bacterium CG10_big_fil_rev_8_21_14_0_10_49_15]|uniref:UDP-N-acetylglucosamine--N-acetylmuramyl-(pentapeptide) pyrophosphoryl-undecaprenol N-acetylglucosamine transferase n=1 Tax=Candidatus Harrisonbacteria bacterium CG10_big_fil_rev_8_21_14_0_10_49_15 TaxID=1974587 RepID=A0A2H0ULG3_9BACT|nr:MAG: hypothetical protein COU11_01645 [Candidatus Harrisonbacteria bacterium CG10_big_fil_rev_8_21_14_0_10_49_15]
MEKIYIGLTAGGTGGHMYPMMAVAEQIKAAAMMQGNDVDLRFFGFPNIFAKELAKQGIGVASVAGSKWRRYGSILNFLDIFKFGFGFLQALWKLFWFMPDALFSKSGPGAMPVILAARWYRIPVVIHETDAVPGRSNVLASKFASRVEVSFAESVALFPEAAQKIAKVVGNPVREAVLIEESRAQSRAALKLPDTKPVLLVLGGSQGAAAINYFILEHSEMLLREFEIVHQIGSANFDGFLKEWNFMTKNFPPELKQNYFPYAFFDEQNLAHALNASDLVVARSGGTVFEIAAHAKPAILVPLPESANGHQLANAYAYQAAGAGIVLEEPNLLIGIFMDQARKLTQASDAVAKMREAAKAFYKPNAARQIAEDVLSLAV